ncbi:MAG: hypothetical protein RDV48_19655 [Candidatus Eremiobacteraeota bacterium]|nr:hypothetical protein [Candidatus Eremiobacteraeota bacterium]
MQKDGAPSSPGDAFTPGMSGEGTAPKAQFASLTSSVLEARGLSKKQNDFRVTATASAPGGTTYVAYTSSRKEKAAVSSYISAVSPQGEIRWERPLALETIYSISSDAEGTLFIRSSGNFTALHADGTVKFDQKLPEAMSGHYADSSGNHYFIKSGSREFFMTGPDGLPRDLPGGLKGIKGQEIAEGPGGTLCVRDGTTLTMVDLEKGTKTGGFAWKDTVEQKPNFARHIDHSELDAEGNVRLFIENTTVSPPPPRYDDFGMGFGGGFGRPFGGRPHLPPHEDPIYDMQVYTDFTLEKYDGAGKLSWKVDGLDDKGIYAPLPDGALVFSVNRNEMIPNPNYKENGGDPFAYQGKTIPSGRVYIGKITPGGKKVDEAFTVEGKVEKILVDKKSGSFVISLGENKFSRFDSQGELIKSHTLDVSKGRFFAERLEGDHHVILKEGGGAKAYSLDMESGTLTTLTDSEADHCYGLAARDLENEVPSGEGKAEVEEFDEWVNVGGIRIQKKQQ